MGRPSDDDARIVFGYQGALQEAFYVQSKEIIYNH
jgi:hypothetical protein